MIIYLLFLPQRLAWIASRAMSMGAVILMVAMDLDLDLAMDVKRDTADQVMDMTRDVTMANQVMAATIRKMVLLVRNTR